jgi:hypothetical protein
LHRVKLRLPFLSHSRQRHLISRRKGVHSGFLLCVQIRHSASVDQRFKLNSCQFNCDPNPEGL